MTIVFEIFKFLIVQKTLKRTVLDKYFENNDEGKSGGNRFVYTKVATRV